jgi:hypothetical protein
MGQYTGTGAKLLQARANEKAGWGRSTTQVWGTRASQKKILYINNTAKVLKLKYTNCCLDRVDSPDDEQQDCSEHVEA